MIASALCRLVLACFVFFTINAYAAAPATLHERANALKLAETSYWHLLLRYEPASTVSGWRSEARSPRFFISKEGSEQPNAELHAMLDSLFTSSNNNDNATACLFPTRTSWLQEQLAFTIDTPACPALDEWKAAIHPTQATLIFAADYLNSPSSMFGHTFLRLDSPEQTEDTRLLAYAVNYAALVSGGNNSFIYAWKGLTGGYPGVFSILPYYDKVQEYSNLENRDIWEYQLSFTPEEVHILLNHLWELRNVEFPYLFLTKNCSYQLLSLFEVARPGLNLRSSFPLQAIPSDTLRRVLKEPGILRKVVYRAAAERRLAEDAHDNTPRVNQAAKELADHPQAIITLSPEAEAAALQTAYDYRYYRFLAGENNADTRVDLRQLLGRRAGIALPDSRTVPPQPVIDPGNAHPTSRIAFGLGSARDASYAALRLRPAYHDLLDPPGGYRRGTHIDVLETEVRVDDHKKTLKLEYLKILDNDSLAPWDPFFRPWSWFLSIGQRQAAVDTQGRFNADDSHGVAYLEGGAGADWSLTGQLECYLQLAGSSEAGKSLDKGWRVGSGPRGGCLYHAARWRFRLQTDGRYYRDIEGMETRTTLQGQFDIAPAQGLRLELGRLQHRGDHSALAELSWLHYF